MADHRAGAGPPAPLRQFIVKLHSRCNLSCSYCYVYQHVDQSWRDRPVTMSPATVSALAGRIGEHARAHQLPEILVVLHGGEPMLAGAARIDHAAAAIRAAVPPATRVELAIQTNGVLLDDEFLEVFHRHRIAVGVSLDGGAGAHDRHRRFADGRGSYRQVRQALRVLASAEHRELFAGLLCTVDLANDPVAVYESLLDFAPPQLDLLLPHGNWAHPPPGREPDSAATPYADWLIAVFDRWYAAPHRPTAIRLFDSLISLLLGGPSTTEAVGTQPAGMVAVETDGSLEPTDALKTTAPGLATTGLTVTRHSFDQAIAHPGIQAAQGGSAGLSPACRRCPVSGVCGGGLYAHRYAPGTGFANPSVYCADLFRLVSHVRARVRADLAARLRHPVRLFAGSG